MKTTTMTAAALALALAPAAWAQRYPGSYDYPRSGQIERVAVLAHQLEDTAEYIHRKAERNNRRPDRDEARVLAQLHELNDEARHFHQQVESYRQDPRHTRSDFRQLVGAYRDTWDSLESISRRPYIDDGMVQIGGLLRELSQYYGGRSRWNRDLDDGRYRDRDGYGRDGRYDGRYGDDWRRHRDDDDHDGYHGDGRRPR